MKFSVKGLMLFVTVIAIMCGGISYSMYLARQAQQQAEIERARAWKAATESAAAQYDDIFGKAIVETYNAKCVRVIDGNTLAVLRDEKEVKIRLDSIDCPEMNQPFGKKAKQHLSKWVFGKQITVHSTGEDRFKRTLAFVDVDDFGEVNKNLIADGMAWHFKKYSNNITLDLFEQDARRRKAGLWSDPNPIPPWEWRKKK